MDSTYPQHRDGVIMTGPEDVPAIVSVENVSRPAAPTPAPVLSLTAPVNINQHSLVRSHRGNFVSQRRVSFNGMSGESSLIEDYPLEAAFEEYKHGDSGCLALRYHGGGFDAILSVHGGTAGAFKQGKFIVRHDGTDDRAPVTRLFIVDLSEHAYKWARDFIGHVTEKMPGGTSGQHMRDTISIFCSTICNSSMPPSLNCHPSWQCTSFTGFTVIQNSADEYPPWTDLPLDCCRLIRDLLDAFSALSFPLVCKHWAEVYAESRRLRLGAPTLLTSPSLDGGWDHPDEDYRGIFFVQNIISPRETFLVEVDDFRHSRWIGGKDKWLVIADLYVSFKLLNPITRACIQLASESVRAWCYTEQIQLCRTPDEANGYFAIAISHDQLAYIVDGSDQWFLLENPSERRYMMMYADAILHRGKIVAICSNGDIWSWDLNGQEEESPKLLFSSSIYSKMLDTRDFFLAPSLNSDNLLIVSPYGEILPLRIARNRSTFRNQWNFSVHGVVLHEVDIDAKSVEDVHDIGNQALFLGPNYPFYVQVSVPSGDLKANHVYITDISDYDVVAIDLGQNDLPNNVTFLDYNGPTNHPHQVPIWFRPDFH